MALAQFIAAPVVANFAAGRIWWDAGMQLELAKNGYAAERAAHFPGMPLLTRAAYALVGDWGWAAVLLATVAGVAAVVMFWKWLELLDVPGRGLALALLLVYPFGFWIYGVPYNDGLFLALAVGAFLAVERDHLSVAALLGVAACATRLVGLVLVIGLVVLAFERRGLRRWRRNLVPAVGLGGTVGFLLYSWAAFGSPWVYFELQDQMMVRVSFDPVTWPGVMFVLQWPGTVARGPGVVATALIQGVLVVAATMSLRWVVRRCG